MTTYIIIGRTNSYIANRDSQFAGKCSVILQSGLTLQEARAELLSMLEECYEVSYPNWGVAMNSHIGRQYCTHNSDGTYSFEYDSRYYYIEEETEEL